MEGATLVFTAVDPVSDANGEARPPWTDVLTITDLGRAVLKGEVDLSVAGTTDTVGSAA